MRTTLRLSCSLLTVLLLGTVFAPILIAQTTQVSPEQAASAAALGQQSLASLLLSFFMPRMLEALKEWDRFHWLKAGAARANRIFAACVSVVQGSGLTWTYHRAGELAGSPDGWQFVLGSKHSSFEEWALACLVAFAAQQYFYEHLPAVQAEAIARAVKES